jgi:hypothetical protein
VADTKPQNPLIAAHPRAYRACVWLSAATEKVFKCGVVVSPVLLVVALVVGVVLELTGLTHGRVWVLKAFFVLAFGIFSVAFPICTALCLLRILIVAFFFARYSLAHILTVTLLLGAGGALVVNLPGVWKLLPIMGLFVLAMVAFFFIVMQDPLGPNLPPGFVRKAIHDQRMRARQSHNDQPR